MPRSANTEHERTRHHALLALRAIADMAEAWPDEVIRKEAQDVLGRMLLRLKGLSDDPKEPGHARDTARRLLAGLLNG